MRGEPPATVWAGPKVAVRSGDEHRPAGFARDEGEAADGKDGVRRW